MTRTIAALALAASALAIGCSPTGRLAGTSVSSIESIEGHREGVVGAIAWRAGDMQVISKVNPYGAYDLYVFTLVLRNVGTVPLTLTRIEWNVMDQDIIRGSPSAQAVSWPLAPQAERRSTWPYSLVCPDLYTCAPAQDAEPSWTFRVTGSTAQGQPVDVPISITLPAQTLRTRFTW